MAGGSDSDSNEDLNLLTEFPPESFASVDEDLFAKFSISNKYETPTKPMKTPIKQRG